MGRKAKESEAIVEADMLYGLWRYFMVNKINI